METKAVQVAAAKLTDELRYVKTFGRSLGNPHDAAALQPLSMPGDIVVADLQSGRVAGVWPAERRLWPVQTPLGLVQTASKPLAVSDDGRRIAIERQQLFLGSGAPPQQQGSLAVIDLERRSALLRRRSLAFPAFLESSPWHCKTQQVLSEDPVNRRAVSQLRLLAGQQADASAKVVGIHPKLKAAYRLPVSLTLTNATLPQVFEARASPRNPNTSSSRAASGIRSARARRSDAGVATLALELCRPDS